LDGKDFAYWPSLNGNLQGRNPRMSGGNFTTMEAEKAKADLFEKLLPQIRSGMLNAFQNK